MLNKIIFNRLLVHSLVYYNDFYFSEKDYKHTLKRKSLPLKFM